MFEQNNASEKKGKNAENEAKWNSKREIPVGRIPCGFILSLVHDFITIINWIYLILEMFRWLYASNESTNLFLTDIDQRKQSTTNTERNAKKGEKIKLWNCSLSTQTVRRANFLHKVHLIKRTCSANPSSLVRK